MKIIKIITTATFFIALSSTTQAFTNNKTSVINTGKVGYSCTWVDGYFRRDGTYVSGYLRCG